MGNFADLILAARTCRRFEEDKPVSSTTLRQMIDAVRITSSASNRQPLRYYTVSTPAVCAQVFPHAKWAGSLPKWPGPIEGERPTGYIVICNAQANNQFVNFDIGIAAQSLQLYATELGLGCCMFYSFSREPVRKILAIPADIEVSLLLAFGAPKEVRKLIDATLNDNLAYWRDEQQVHYVPKLTIDQVLLGEK